MECVSRCLYWLPPPVPADAVVCPRVTAVAACCSCYCCCCLPPTTVTATFLLQLLLLPFSCYCCRCFPLTPAAVTILLLLFLLPSTYLSSSSLWPTHHAAETAPEPSLAYAPSSLSSWQSMKSNGHVCASISTSFSLLSSIFLSTLFGSRKVVQFFFVFTFLSRNFPFFYLPWFQSFLSVWFS